jgi:hypothetical protein
MASRTSPWGKELAPRNRTAVKQKSQADHGPVEATSTADEGRLGAGRTSVIAGQKSLPDVDGRSAFSRRKRALVAAFVADLGGLDEVSTAERILADKAATLTLQLQSWAAKMDEGDVSNATLDLYGRGCGHLTRMLKVLGIKRRAKDVSPGQRLIELYKLEGKIPDDEENENEKG